MNLHNTISGEYKLIINHADGTKTETDWFDNLVLNTGLDYLGTGAAPFVYCRLGAGVSTPIETQISLDSQIAYSSSNSGQAQSAVNQGAPTYACLYTFGWTFAQGSVVGNISEIGVGWTNGTAGGGLFSRALITDSLGNPISITIIAIDQLTVYYRVKIIPSLATTYGSFQVNGVTYNYSSRLCNAGSFGAWYLTFYYGWSTPWSVTFYNASPTLPTLGNVYDGGANGTAGSSWSQTQSYGSAGNYSYIQSSYYIDSSWSVGIQLGNASGGIGGFKFSWGNNSAVFSFQIVLDKAIPKDNTQTFVINTRLSWSR